jgi:peptidoglycan hydrolase-like protein with peptidoglycan-binding domain
MGVVTARLVFLAFFGLTGTIIYNALYLQDHAPRGAASTTTAHKAAGESSVLAVTRSTTSRSQDAPTVQATSPAEPESVAPVSTDLPPLDPGTGESQLVIRAVQRELAARGYDVGPLDGALSDKTRAAISTYQSAQGLAVTGVPSDELLRQILLGDSLESAAATGSLAASDSIETQAAESATVKGVQQVLADLGYAPGPIDGEWGENTSRAIAAFQRDRNIAETGQITPELLGELRQVSGRDFTKIATHP